MSDSEPLPLSISTDSLNLSNNDIHLIDVSPNMMTFTWDPVANLCPSILYHIETNCGMCIENITTDTTVTCSRITTIASNNNCSFAVHASAMCGMSRTIFGIESSISLKLSGKI